ncbi:hypothetical protein FJ420_23830 [Mesorhizobium sp. B3-1-3]|uniref:hypothetical protein n=1 Tax=unclassified Mesorhizobium TaxID=325217 RepID=UPI001125C5BA|nr:MULTISPECIES: hypothetical protein [unclassified Mesorhizobium]TPI66790.1 hypothetical protein FJ420_23830 [Mesorhizobium sp. B3-1-3]TPI70625.1 hypothetical protein FJ424_01945 [Mesorhizobium sp. B3-1-8]TPJ32529.1 hypothetical protein FJ418_17450 [Mesorhizobium sp. B2-8-3]UCI24917.1 hypothetical protein FJ430_25545 [Mesorhizobium sp. B2-8-5]
MPEPTPHAFGKFDAKAPAASVAEPVRSKRLEHAATRGLATLSSHGSLALKLYVMLWIVALAVSVFVMVKA